MPKLSSNRVPAYRLHKASGQAVVTLDGRDHYLGDYGSADSREKYERMTGEWKANGRHLPIPAAQTTIAIVVRDYWRFCQGYYTGKAGAGLLRSLKLLLKEVRTMYGDRIWLREVATAARITRST